MTLLIALTAAAATAGPRTPIAVVVGARPLWARECIVAGEWDRARCVSEELQHVDDDAWRAAEVLARAVHAYPGRRR